MQHQDCMEDTIFTKNHASTTYIFRAGRFRRN